MRVTRCEHYVCTKKLKTLPKKTPKKNIKELKNHTQKNNKNADAVVVVLFLFFMFYVTYDTSQNLHVYSQQYFPYTSVNSSFENLGFKSNNISNWYPNPNPNPNPKQGENALNTKLLQFLSFIKLCDSKSSVVRI